MASQKILIISVFLFLAVAATNKISEEVESLEDFSPLTQRSSNLYKRGFFDDLKKKIKDAFACKKTCKSGHLAKKPKFNNTVIDGCGTYGIHIQYSMCIYLNDCCNKHDACYYLCGKTKETCDQEFKDCTQNPTVIENDSKFDINEVKNGCKSLGNGMVGLVEALGCSAFTKAQDEACQCV